MPLNIVPLPRMWLNSGDPNEAFAVGMFVHECVGQQQSWGISVGQIESYNDNGLASG